MQTIYGLSKTLLSSWLSLLDGPCIRYVGEDIPEVNHVIYLLLKVASRLGSVTGGIISVILTLATFEVVVNVVILVLLYPMNSSSLVLISCTLLEQ